MATPDTAIRPRWQGAAYILRLAGLSTTAIKVLRTCNEPNTCANDLNRVISLDPVLTGRVLQLIQLRLLLPAEQGQLLTRAIILLGNQHGEKPRAEFCHLREFSQRDSFRVFSADEFWTHSLSTRPRRQSSWPPAAGCRCRSGRIFCRRADARHRQDPSQPLVPEAYREAAEISRDRAGDALRRRYADRVDHCRVRPSDRPEMAAEPHLAAALSDHHADDYRGQTSSNVADVVALADALAHRMGAGIPRPASAWMRRDAVDCTHAGNSRSAI